VDEEGEGGHGDEDEDDDEYEGGDGWDYYGNGVGDSDEINSDEEVTSPLSQR
jgi:hypothetical protein